MGVLSSAVGWRRDTGWPAGIFPVCLQSNVFVGRLGDIGSKSPACHHKDRGSTPDSYWLARMTLHVLHSPINLFIDTVPWEIESRTSDEVKVTDEGAVSFSTTFVFFFCSPYYFIIFSLLVYKLSNLVPLLRHIISKALVFSQRLAVFLRVPSLLVPVIS